MTDPTEDVKWITMGKRYCENCKASVSHNIGAKPDGTPVKNCLRCDLVSRN